MAANLVTLAEYKAYIGITSPNQDGPINAMLPKVSALIKNLCRRTFVDYVLVDKVEYFDGGTEHISPEEYPIISVTSLEYSSDYGSTYVSLANITDYAIRKTSGNIIPTKGSKFSEAVNGYKLTYKAGYTELPEDLKLAVLDLITYYIKNDAAIHSSKAPGTNSVQIEYVTTTNLPAHIKRVLDLYMANYY